MFMMRFDMRVPGMTSAQITDQYHCAIEMAQWAEGKGCVGIGISEHHCSDDGYTPSPLILASAMAAVTKKTPINAGELKQHFAKLKEAEDAKKTERKAEQARLAGEEAPKAAKPKDEPKADAEPAKEGKPRAPDAPGPR